MSEDKQRPNPKVCLKCYRLNPGERTTCITCKAPLEGVVELDIEKAKEYFYELRSKMGKKQKGLDKVSS